MPYLGNEPAVAYTSTTKDTFSGDGSTTDFTMSKSANVNAVRVVVENVIQDPTVAYTCSGTTLSFTSAPPTGTNNIYVVHLGPPAATVAPPTTINNATTFTGGVTLKNETAEDTDGGRESIVTFQGTQSGNEITTLAQIQASHDGTSDDEKGDLIFKTNDGSDGASPTEVMRLDSGGTVNISSPSNARALKMQNGANNSASQITFLSDDGTEDSFIRNQSSTTGADILSLGTGGSERWRITSTGNFKAMSNGLGIDFSATEGSNAASSILDDYEEGNWTADVSVGTVSNVSQATYTKIGNVVHVQCKLNSFSESSSSASLTITGMPYPGYAADISAIATSALSKNISGTNDINVYFPTTTSIYLYGSITGGEFDNLKYSDLSSGMILYLGFSYFAA